MRPLHDQSQGLHLHFGALIQVHTSDKGNPLDDPGLRRDLMSQLHQNHIAADVFLRQGVDQQKQLLLTGAEYDHMARMAPRSAKPPIQQRALEDIWTLAPENRRLTLQVNPFADAPLPPSALDKIRDIDAHPHGYPSPYGPPHTLTPASP